MTLRVHLWPQFNTPDDGDGGVRRVVEAQTAYLPQQGIELVEDPAKADVLACHIQIPDEFLRRFPTKPIVAHLHGFYWDEYRRADTGESSWERWCLQANGDVMKAVLAADIVTAPTDWVAQATRRNTCRDVRVVPHGIDLDDWPGQSNGGAVVLWNKSRPDPVCDPEPVNKLAKLMPDVHFVTTFAGWSGEPPGNVTVTGRVPHAEARKQMLGAGVYLCTTRETFGIGTLEAMAAGVPVVGWKWGGQREFIEHGVDGWLAQPHDYEGLVEGIRWALANRRTIVAAARAKAATFTWERAAAMYADVYREARQMRGQEPFGADTPQMRHAPRQGAAPKVSVIVTAYNLEKYLPMALASVLKQDDHFTDWECIIVDDHSPDGCGEIAEQWQQRDPRFRAFHLTTNRYLAGARNAGVAIARGEYIMPLDADDMLADGALKVLAEALDADRLISVAYGGVFFVEEDGMTPTDYGYGTPGLSGWPIDFRIDQQVAAPPAGRRPNNLLPYASMIRRRALELTGGYRERRRTAEDADLWCRLSSYGFTPKRVTSSRTLIYRNREDSMSRREAVDDWTTWYPWSRLPDMTPAGAMRNYATTNTLAVNSCDPVVVSVIIPVGPGHETLVKDAVDSVDAQTLRQFECIVVNDTGAPLSNLPTWVRIIDAEQIGETKPGEWVQWHGVGVARARNIGIAAANAKLYVPLDADDTLMPHALRVLFEEYMKGDGQIIYSDFFEDPEREGDFRVYESPDFHPRILIQNGMCGAVTQLTPVEAWAKVGGYDEDLPAWEDWAFQIKLCHAGYCMRRVPTPLWTYRKHTGKRRDVQYARRNDEGGGKESIVRKFPALWPAEALALGIEIEGEYDMGCQTCGGGGTGSGIVNIAHAAERKVTPPTAEGAVLVEYIGDKRGSIEYRIETEAIYHFAAGDPPVYVHPKDLEWFRLRDDFRIVEGSVAQSAEPVFAAPRAASEDVGVVAEPEQTAEEEVQENLGALEQKRRKSKASAGKLPEGVTVE